MTLGANLKKHRKRNGLSLRALAERANVSNVFICQIENNGCIPSARKAYDLAKALGVRIEDLLGRKPLERYGVMKDE